MSGHRRVLRCVALLGLLAPALAAAQGNRPADVPERRARMEQQVRQGLWRAAQQRIGLTDEQMGRLRTVTTKYDARRQALHAEERETRQTLRAELTAGDRANQARVGAALDRLLVLQRQRLDLMVEEQRDLSAFMTPVQRARYSALQEQLRRRVDALRRGRRGGVPAPR